MNEVYQDLAGQAADECNLGVAWEWERKYALLVIKEVLDVVRANISNSYIVVEAVNTHFGIVSND